MGPVPPRVCVCLLGCSRDLSSDRCAILDERYGVRNARVLRMRACSCERGGLDAGPECEERKKRCCESTGELHVGQMWGRGLKCWVE